MECEWGVDGNCVVIRENASHITLIVFIKTLLPAAGKKNDAAGMAQGHSEMQTFLQITESGIFS